VVIRDRERPLASHAAARSRAVARRGARPGPPGPPLTAREREVAALLAARRTNGEIAAALGVSPHTARHHTERVLQKFGVTSRRALPAGLAAALAPGGPLFGA
jgi:DNA-binding CsgD family transcriptional regulator